MSVTVHVPFQLRDLFGARPEEHVDAADVVGALAALDARYPGLAARVLEPDGRPRRHVSLYVNRQPVAPEGLGAALADGDTLWIIPAVSGG
jgi:molybdopterin converting factor small subunit